MDKHEQEDANDEIEIIDLDAQPFTFSILRKYPYATLFRHKRAGIAALYASLCLFLLTAAFSIPSVRNNVWSKVSGIPLNAITVKVGGREVYGYRKMDDVLLWHVTLDSPSSQPLQVVGNDVYILSEGNVLYDFNTYSGALVWRYHASDDSMYRPLVTRDMVYVSSPGGVVRALHNDNGSLRWKTLLPGTISAPLVTDGNLLYVCLNHTKIVALWVTDGSVDWQNTSALPITSELVLQQKTLYFMSGHEKLVALDSSSGSLLWEQQEANPFPDMNRADNLFVSGNTIVWVSSDVNGDNGKNYMMALSGPYGSSLLWFTQLSKWSVRSVMIDGQSLYLLTLDGTITKYDSSTGKAVWHTWLGDAYSASTTVVNDNVYVYAIDGAFDVLSTVNGSFKLHQRTNFLVSSPTIVNNNLYIESHDLDDMRQGEKQYYAGIVAFNAETGVALWHYFAYTPLSELTYFMNTLYVNDIQGLVYAFDAKNGSLLWKH